MKYRDLELVKSIENTGATSFAMDSVPCITRAQSIDVLSSMSNIGYNKETANECSRFLAGQITAAGKVQPSKLFIIGGGTAGLSAVVKLFDTRAAVKKQVESSGCLFVTVDIKEDEGGGYAKEIVDAEMTLFGKDFTDSDIIITTALIPGKTLKDMVDSMKPCSVIVDLASESGGNCEYTRQNERFDIETQTEHSERYDHSPHNVDETNNTITVGNEEKELLVVINIIGREESKEIGAPFTVLTEATVVAVMITIIIFIFGYLLAPLCGVHTGLFGGLLARLFFGVLSIINSLFQALGGDIKRRLGGSCQSTATGATTGNFNGQCGTRCGGTADRVNGFFDLY